MGVDWDALQIGETVDEEGRLEVATDDQLYDVLGLRAEDERAAKGRRGVPTIPHVDIGDDGAAIIVDDSIPNEREITYDSDNPEFKLGALFPSMEKFRLAVRQYAMNEEFELHVAKTTKTRYDGYCKGDAGCTWHVHGKPEINGGKTIIVIILSLPFPFGFLSYHILSFSHWW